MSESVNSPLPSQSAFQNLDLRSRHLAKVEGWGMAVSTISHVYMPESAEQIFDVLELAKRRDRKIVLRGGGNSYGDAAILADSITLDLTRMNKVLAWDPAAGIIDLEPGVTIQQLWQTVIPDGWWPPVVSGTMFTTMGGCAAMNIHGKNNYRMGPFGEHIVEFDFLPFDGNLTTVSKESDSVLFHSVISGAGLLGIITRIRLHMKKVYSGLLSVEAFQTHSFGHIIDEFESRVDHSDYLVGWIDCIPGGRRSLGRGIVHAAHYLKEGEDPRPGDTLTLGAQELPSKLFGMVPKSMLHLFMGPFINNPGVRLINAMKYHSSRLQPNSWVHYQSHGAFAFLLDYVPNWKHAYKPVGLIQYQPFIPKETAEAAFEEILRVCQKAGLPPYLGVFKKHRPDNFLLSHAVDGYSLALDFRVTRSNRDRLWRLCSELDSIVLQAGGRFYFAKDATLTPEAAQRYLGDAALNQLRQLKREYDPAGVFDSQLAQRLNLIN